MEELLNHFNTYEDQIGATTDAIIHKAMQE
jgi:hypothetical protein